MPSNTPATNPYVSALTASTTFVGLPMKNSMGGCTGSALRDMNNVKGSCRVNVASTAGISGNIKVI